MLHSVLLLARFLARKIRVVVAAPCAGEMRHLGIGTERARPRYLVGFDASKSQMWVTEHSSGAEAGRRLGRDLSRSLIRLG
jgi:hypothetical protein